MWMSEETATRRDESRWLTMSMATGAIIGLSHAPWVGGEGRWKRRGMKKRMAGLAWLLYLQTPAERRLTAGKKQRPNNLRCVIGHNLGAWSDQTDRSTGHDLPRG